MNSITCLAPAKINFDLKIGELQKNALHELETVMHKINLCDEIRIIKLSKERRSKSKIRKKGQQKIIIQVSGDQKRGVPSNSDNLVYKAAKLFFEQTGIKSSIEIKIKKNIPNCAGLAGASSDAGATLKSLFKLFKKELHSSATCLDWSTQHLILNILSLGSDVPFFVHNISHAKVSSTGEKIEKLKPKKFYSCICILPRIRVSTAWAFKQFDNFATKILPLKSCNDFEKVIFYHFPDLADLRDELIELGADYAGLSGSGSAIFGIFRSEKDLKKCEKKIANKCDFFWSGESFI